MAAAEKWSRAWEAYEALYSLLHELKIWEAKHKRCQPNVCMSFLGIAINSLKLMLSLTPERLLEIKSEANKWLNKNTTSKKDMQRLVGKLNFAASTVKSGRLFFSRILAFMNKLPKHGVRTLPPEVKKDCRWWAIFMEHYDGVSFIHEVGMRPVDSVISTDACLDAMGAFFEGEYVHAKFPLEITQPDNVSINELECLALVVALKIWGGNCTGLNLLFHCDNSSTVDVVNAGKAKNTFAQSCLREIVLSQCEMVRIYLQLYLPYIPVISVISLFQVMFWFSNLTYFAHFALNITPLFSQYIQDACQSSIQTSSFYSSRYNLLCHSSYLYGRPYCTVL